MRALILLALMTVPAATNPPATGADWEREGRPLPVRERDRPALDPALRRYVARVGISGSLDGSATSVLPELAKRWSTAFAARQPAVAVNMPPPFGAPQAKLSPRLRDFIEGGQDFALMSRGLSESDRAAFRRSHGFDPTVVPVANGSWRHFGFVDAVAVVVNAANPVKGLSFAQLDALFSANRRRGHPAVVTWGDLGVARWADKAVRIAGAESWTGEDSARAGFIRDRVLLGGPWRTGAGPRSGTEAEVPAMVSADPYAIGFTGMGHLVPGIRALAVREGNSGALVAPTHLSVAKGHYPLGRTVDMLVARRPGTCLDPALAEWIRFLVSREGQRIVSDQGIFLPLRASQAEASLRLASCPQSPQSDTADPPSLCCPNPRS